MTVLDTQMHVVTFLITVFESVMLFFFTVYYLSRPSDKSRLWYLILLLLLIQYNISSGLFPDENISIPIKVQIILAYLGGISVSMYFVFYIYKAFNLEKLRFYAIQGSIWFLFLPFIVFFTVPYMITGNLDLSRKLVVIVPFVFAIFYVYTLSKSLWRRYQEKKNRIEGEEIIGVYVSVLLWATLPIIVYFDGSQLVENGTTNAGFMIMSILFVRSAIIKSREDYNLLVKSQEELQKANENLQKKVEERTRQLKEANDKRENTFINLIHETKTPLTLINNYLDEFIEKYGKNEELEITKFNMDKLTRNMVNYFDMYKINKGMAIYDHDQETDVSDIVQKDLMLLRFWANQKEIRIHEHIEPGIMVKADPEAISRIVSNLVENAIKYTPTNGLVEVKLTHSKNKVLLQVKDTGLGIPEENQEHIFEPFYQVSHPKNNSQGIGLGLSIVKKTLDELKGEIQLDSKEGLGTVIRVLLPLYERVTAKDVEKTNNSPRMDMSSSGAKEFTYVPELNTILLVEDKTQLLAYLRKKLAKRYNVFTAINGLQALQVLKEMPKPDLIISDIMMDEMDGFAFLKVLRNQEQYRNIPTIFLTAKSTREDKLRGLKLGAMDFICKPFNYSELEFKIRALLENNDNQKLELIHQSADILRKRQNGKRSELSWKERCEEHNLSERETEILRASLEGKTNEETGEELNIAGKTVSKHLSNIYAKFGVKNRLELMNCFRR